MKACGEVEGIAPLILISVLNGGLSSSLRSKNLKIKIYRTIILPVVLCGCETWSLTLREERRLRVLTSHLYISVHYRKYSGISSKIFPVGIVTLWIKVGKANCCWKQWTVVEHGPK
jgi:hypothetical protein